MPSARLAVRPLALALFPLLALAALLSRPTAGRASNAFASDTALQRAVEDQGRRFVEAVNAADPAAATRAVVELYDSETVKSVGESKLAGAFARIREQFGALEYHHSEAIAGGDGATRRYSLHVYAKSAKDGGWHDLQFFLAPSPPHRFTQLVFAAEVAEPVYLPNGDFDDAAARAWFSDYVAKLERENDLSGGILIARGERLLFERVFGFADAARRRPITTGTRFSLASGGKMFTALLVAQLVERRRLSFDDRLARLLPLVSKQPYVQDVTIGQLLSHTSGIGEYWTEDFERHWGEIRTLADFEPWIAKAGRHSPPGARYEYSNSNYILLGLVLEGIYGEPYETIVRERLFEPLGLAHTSLGPFDDDDSLAVQRLKRAGAGWAVAGHLERGSSAGGALSTMGDLLRFSRALVAGRIVSDTLLARMTNRQTPPGEVGAYGYGFLLEGRTRDARSFGHGGIARGVNFEYRYFPASDVTLIAFSNQDNGAYDDLRRNATKLVTGER